MARALSRSFYARDTRIVARELLGCVLARRLGGATLRARIVETEAYIGEDDLACHARAGRTPRTDVMYGPPGVAYVYFTYGMHHLLNAVTEKAGMPAAVLIRAAEPMEGIEAMERARRVAARRPVAAHHIASGPSRLCQALGIDLRQNRADLRGPVLWIEAGDGVPERAVRTSPRIGCSHVPAPWGGMPWRYFVAGSPHVTPGRAERRRKRGGNGGAHRE